jgi:ketosteroid isomerase-like protein
MAGELEAVVREGFAALDRNDFDGILPMFDDEAQGVDEISRRWLRGHDEVAGHLRLLETSVQDVRSHLRDVHETTWGDTGLVTGWIEQDYTLDGQRQHVSGPVTAVLRRGGGHWKIVLIHSVPLPEDTSSEDLAPTGP